MGQTMLSQGAAAILDFAGDRWQSPDLVRSWKRLLGARVNHGQLCQTPQYFEHLSTC
jgi:hypothetical protein